MKTKHLFVAAVDVNEFFPFALKRIENIDEAMKQQQKSKSELIKFIDLLEKSFGQNIYYMGTDIIDTKTYERFIFEEGGFFEVMMEVPLALNAHFVDKKEAEVFKSALKSVLTRVLPDTPVRQMFIDSIEVQDENQENI